MLVPSPLFTGSDKYNYFRVNIRS